MIPKPNALVAWNTVVREWAPVLLLLIGAVLVAYVVEHFALRALRRYAERSKSDLDDVILKAVHPAVVLVAGIVAFWIGMTYVGPPLDPAIDFWISRLSVGALVIMAAWIGSRLIRGLLHRSSDAKRRYRPITRLGGRLASILVYAIGFLIVLDFYGLSITPILTGLGLAGLAVALALEDTLSNFFAGLWVQTGRGIDPGHYVRLQDKKVEGYVVEVGWRTTKIREPGNNLIIVPNNQIAKSIVIDFDLPTPQMGTSIEVRVAIDSDIGRVQHILVEEARKGSADIPGLLKDPAPAARFSAFGEYFLEFVLGFNVREFADQAPVQHELRSRILRRFRQEGIRIPYPVRETLPSGLSPPGLPPMPPREPVGAAAPG